VWWGRAAIALLLGVFGIVAGIEAAHYTSRDGLSLKEWALVGD